MGGRPVQVGRVSGVFGVRGWVRVYSYTDPPENILGYGPWSIGDVSYRVLEGSSHGRGLVARLQGVDDRDAARALIGQPINVPRGRLGRPAEGQYYWDDLLGLQVVNLQGIVLGSVTGLMATGANDVLVLQSDRRRLVPFVTGTVIRDVDLAGGRIDVDWDADI